MTQPRILLAALFAVLTLVAPVLAPASASGARYVALGDSYSSGVGTRAYLDDGSSCRRSRFAYPSLLARQRGYALSFKACSGAKIADVATRQLGALSSATAYVTVSVGGNDAGFSSVLTTCAKPAWLSDCDGAIDKARAYVAGVLPGRLARLYTSIRSRAPRAKVVVVGYPRLFNGEDCQAGTFFSFAEESRLNRTADLLNAKLAAAAAARGFAFADPAGRFAGHAVCDDVAWINGLSWPVVESFHPNRTGHARGYLALVAGRLA